MDRGRPLKFDALATLRKARGSWFEKQRERMLFRCQPGFERHLADELASESISSSAHGAGWVMSSDLTLTDERLNQLCFPHETLLDEREITGESVNALADAIASYFFEAARNERFEGKWVLRGETAGGQDGLGRRADAVMRALGEILKKRMSRVAKLASDDRPDRGEARGLFVYFTDFRQAWVSRRAFFGGQRRMADDPLAPSRSYLKIEEAYQVLGREPAAGETVVDLGAAPGGWSYSAAKRGARVIAVDNGPLKGGALNHPQIEHRREDAFGFRPAADARVDWMLCDLVEEPHHVMQNLMDPWLRARACRWFVVILKFGRVDPIALLKEIHDPRRVFQTETNFYRVRHLFHDREELTIVGETKN